MKDIVIDLIEKQVGLDKNVIGGLIEVPPKLEMGDFAFPCFSLAKEMRKSPVEIAKDLAGKIKDKNIDKVEAVGPYVNFFVDRVKFAEGVLNRVGEIKKLDKREKVVIDMSSPNIAKPFGIGHLRSTIIGNSIAKICEAVGGEAVKINYLGDWGTQFGKIIWGWKKWGDEEELEKDAIGALQRIYVMANKYESDSEEVAEMRNEFKKLENGDKENVELWKRFKDLSLKKFEEIYGLLGVSFDVVSGESFYNDKMDSVLIELKERGLLKEDKGARIVDLEDDGLGVALIQKSDGTSLYVTRDLAAIEERMGLYDFDKIVYEVGSEQSLHFKQLFKILEKLGYAWSKDCYHVAHGLYLDTDGKKFSTRKGKTVYMEDILDEVVNKAMENLIRRDSGLEGAKLGEKARKIAIAAIFYGDLKNNREHNMVFDVDKFLAFEGDTGPYLLYGYARASTLLKKSGKKIGGVKVAGDVEDIEFKLIKKLGDFSDVVGKAYENWLPNLVANYCYELVSDFNEFYHACPVLGGEKEAFRLGLVSAFRDVLGKGLDLLGIEKLEEM